MIEHYLNTKNIAETKIIIYILFISDNLNDVVQNNFIKISELSQQSE